MRKIALLAFSEAGCRLAGSLCEKLELPREAVHTIEKFAPSFGFTAHKNVCADMGSLFDGHEALIFVCACGIAVRDIAPHLKSKATDPAVLVVDDKGRFVIPILSGHLGGANRLALEVAGLLPATPVITTATDIHGRFSPDGWAAEHRCTLSSLGMCKEISARILTGDLPICAEFPLPGALPGGLFRGETGAWGIYLGVHTRTPFQNTLRLIPRILVLGIGCRRGTSAAALRETVAGVFLDHDLDPAAVREIATISLKADEEGLLAYGRERGLPLKFYTAEELAAVPGDFAESSFVRKTVGVGNVCERAALAALSGKGRILLPKTAGNGVTVAVAAADWRVSFE